MVFISVRREGGERIMWYKFAFAAVLTALETTCYFCGKVRSLQVKGTANSK
jgi:hypothetical protein